MDENLLYFTVGNPDMIYGSVPHISNKTWAKVNYSFIHVRPQYHLEQQLQSRSSPWWRLPDNPTAT